MNALLSVPPSTVRTVLHCFLYFEFSIHIVGFVVSAVFLVVFSRLRTIHVNLIWILDSFVLAFCITSAWRIYYCITLLVLDVDAGNPALLLGTDMRDTCGLHLLLLAGERLLATVRSRTYEKENHPFQILAVVLSTWIFSYLVVISLRDQVFTNFLAAFIFLLIYGISIALMFYVRKTNLNIWKSNRGKLLVSQNYQVHENVRSARFLYKCFVVFAGQTFIGWCCLVVYLIFKRVYQVPILEKVFGFAFDIMLASQTTALPLTIVKYSDKLCMQFRRTVADIHFYFRPNTGPKGEQRSHHLVDLEGRNLRIETREETKTYFDLFKTAWS
ncbi:unnamed protein product [Nippostrongylus brasiliensis]|uniref:G protein-coupled receptor n=1 Tax=Nippostrongylus brasiliensis TaxID=27835 RepID=A0A0N4XEJ4_NIPBR|nr:unnamed protein product [Nippostrongylus brasiliensis]